jgi:hypothetical protein
MLFGRRDPEVRDLAARKLGRNGKPMEKTSAVVKVIDGLAAAGREGEASVS